MKIKSLLFICVVLLTQLTHSQNADTTLTKTEISPQNAYITGALSVTNNGVSTVPYLSLGKPAFIADMSLGKGKFSFDPQLKFDLEGVRPWSFLFWFRYKAVENDKFKFTLGAHPAYSFKTRTTVINDVEQEAITVWRFLATEVSSRYQITPNFNIGPYYLYSYNMEQNVTKHTQFVSLQSTISQIRLSDEFYMNLNPQLYYLKVGRQQGFYAYASVTLAKRDFPLSISALANKEIKSDVAGSQNFLWNVTLTYSFKRYSLSR